MQSLFTKSFVIPCKPQRRDGSKPSNRRPFFSLSTSNLRCIFLTTCNHSSQSHLSFLANPNDEMKVNLHFTLPVQNRDKKTKHKVKRAIIKNPHQNAPQLQSKITKSQPKKRERQKQNRSEDNNNKITRPKMNDSQMRYTSVSFLCFTR